MNFEIPVDEELRYLANAMTEQQRKGMFLANAVFSSDAQRKAVMAKLNPGGGGGIYGDTAHFKDEETVMKDTAEMWGYDVNDPVFREAWEKAFVDNLARDGYTRDDWNNYKGELGHSCRREQFSVVAASTINDYLPGKPTLKNREISDTPLLANAFRSDAQRRFVMAKLRNGEPGGNPYGDPDEIWEWKLKDMYEHVDDVDAAIKESGLDMSKPVDYKEFKRVMDMDSWCNWNAMAWYHRYQELSNREPYAGYTGTAFLENKELTDEQRKAIFAKYGGGGGGSGGKKQSVYSGTGVLKGDRPSGIPAGAVATWDDYADKMVRDDEGILGDKGAYVRQGDLDEARQARYQPGKTLTQAEVDSIRGGSSEPQHKAIDPATGKPLQEGQGSWSHLGNQTASPSDQARQDLSVDGSASSGGGASSSSGGGSASSDGSSSAGESSSSAGGGTVGSLSDAIDSIDTSADGPAGGVSNGPTALDDFLSALANAHF